MDIKRLASAAGEGLLWVEIVKEVRSYEDQQVEIVWNIETHTLLLYFRVSYAGVLFMFTQKYTKSLMAKFSKIDAKDIADKGLRNKATKLLAKQAGFTLLELLVVVSILAAIAGTASIALQDTDARASAAVHVTMMDELNKGIRTYRVLRKNSLPNNFDSLLQSDGKFAGGDLGSATSILGFDGSLGVATLDAPTAEILSGGGITALRYLNVVVDGPVPEDVAAKGCEAANLQNTIASRSNMVVANNIFMGPKANGCGISVELAVDSKVAIWTGGYERVMGSAGTTFDTTDITVDAAGVMTTTTIGAPVLMAVGVGPNSSLFNANELGGMTTVPVYRHVSELQYGRFVALFNIGTFADEKGVVTASDQVVLTAIIDGAGDTKEEELGEWDGTRNTI